MKTVYVIYPLPPPPPPPPPEPPPPPRVSRERLPPVNGSTIDCRLHREMIISWRKKIGNDL